LLQVDSTVFKMIVYCVGSGLCRWRSTTSGIDSSCRRTC